MTFDVAADAYDRYMGAWSRLIAPQLIDLVAMTPGQRVLDVGCGPGALLDSLVARVGSGSLAGVDPSASFIEAARHRHPAADIRVARAEVLPFPDNEFDAALAQLVVHFMTDPVAGLGEMRRVTKPGGTVAAAVWDFAGGRGPLGPFWEQAAVLDPGLEDESLLAGARAGHLVELFALAGLPGAREVALTASRAFDDFDAWWLPFTRGVGPGGAYLATLSAEQQANLRERCRSVLPTGPFVLTATAWATCAIVDRTS
jgi:SAM-dependent methyltransferase